MPTMLDLSRTSGNISEGTHAFKVTKVEEKVSSNGNPTLWIFMNCIDEVGPDKGKQQLLFLTNTPAARFKIDQFLDAIKAPTTGQMSVNGFVGKKLRCTIKESTRNEGRMEVDQMLPFADSMQLEIDFNAAQDEPEDSTTFEIPGIPDSEASENDVQVIF